CPSRPHRAGSDPRHADDAARRRSIPPARPPRGDHRRSADCGRRRLAGRSGVACAGPRVAAGSHRRARSRTLKCPLACPARSGHAARTILPPRFSGGIIRGIYFNVPCGARQMPLTDTIIRRARPAAKPVRLFDGGGLYIEVSPAGGKLWRFKYRFAGKEKRLALGAYPVVPLAGRADAITGEWIPGAREKRDEARRLLASGVDPAESRKARKAPNRGAASQAAKAGDLPNETAWASRVPGRRTQRELRE